MKPARIAYWNQKAVYGLLFRASAETGMTIAADPKRLGAKVGMTSVLHAWCSSLTHHPHIHMIVPGGGLSPDGTRWIACKPGFFLHVRMAAPILRIKEAYMLVMICLLCTVGVYFVRGNPFDLIVMAIAGILGFVLRRQGYPMAPLVIGMVLGPTLEISLRQGLIITDGSFSAFFVGHPIAAVLAIAAIGMLSLPMIRALKARKIAS